MSDTCVRNLRLSWVELSRVIYSGIFRNYLLRLFIYLLTYLLISVRTKEGTRTRGAVGVERSVVEGRSLDPPPRKIIFVRRMISLGWVQISHHNDVTLMSFFGSWFHVFSAYPRGCKFWCWKCAGVTLMNWHWSKTTNKDTFQANLVHLCNSVKLFICITPKFYFQRPAVVEIPVLITNRGWSLFIGSSGTPCIFLLIYYFPIAV